MTARLAISTDKVTALAAGWRMALTPAGACPTPADAARLTDWTPAPVPGTAAEALRRAGRWTGQSLHDQDVWYRLELSQVLSAPFPLEGGRVGDGGVSAGEDASSALGAGALSRRPPKHSAHTPNPALPPSANGKGSYALECDGLATLAEIWIGDRLVATSRSMFAPLQIDLFRQSEDSLWFCFRALGPVIAERGPKVRWRPQMITPQGVRTVRTTLFGHMPGWCPGVDAVGPWRPVSLVERGPVRVSGLILQADYDGARGLLHVEATIDGVGQNPVLECAGRRTVMRPLGLGRYAADLALDDIQPWWLDTHGDQPLYPVVIQAGDSRIDLGRTGFRRIEVDRGLDGKGFGLVVNGAPVFCRGACWSSPDITALPGDREAYRPWLELAREAHVNMIRIPGTGAYETADFYALCDELGILVWQDFMLANFDYPADEDFKAQVAAEAEALLQSIQGSPSLAVLCGGSEVFQQAAMLGLPAEAWGGPIFDEVLAGASNRLRPDVPYVPNSPSGGALPFVVNAGVGHYYGVGAYLRPLEDARRAEVSFASECLAFANLPNTMPDPADPAIGVPRDRGAEWDFADVRDHYLGRLHGVDPAALRAENPALYLDLSRAVTGEVMEATFAEWRRGRSPTRGGLVLAWQDLAPGAGWGVIDHAGEPKAAFHALKRAFRPVQLTLTDEGVNGLAIHLINDSAAPVAAAVELTCLREGQVPILAASRGVTLAPRSAEELSAYELLGAFFDLTYAYRFGAPEHDAVVARLIAADGALLAEAVHFPQGRGCERPAPRVEARVEREGGDFFLVLTTDRLAESVHIMGETFRAEDDWLHLTPGRERRLRMIRRPDADQDASPRGEVRGPGRAWRAGYG